MPDSEKFDLDYRPRSYWGPQDLGTHYGARVKGELRRQVVLSDLEAGTPDTTIMQSALTKDERRAAGAVHPWFMGGEYLPDLLGSEVEIARVTMKSTTMDVISIRARRTKTRIVYRIVDEYMDDHDEQYRLVPKTSRRPLSMAQVIKLIELNNLIDRPRAMNYECCSAEEVHDFCTVSSSFYPELRPWFDESNREWLVREEAQHQEDEFDIRIADHEEDGGTNATSVSSPLKRCVASATWPIEAWNGAGGLVRVFNMALRRRAAGWFAEGHLKQNGELPVGTFNFKVTYGPGGGANIEPPLGDSSGEKDVQITFPKVEG